MQLRFSKYEGLGNDFVVVPAEHDRWLTPDVARRLCDRHFGIGADGVLFAGVDAGLPRMSVINADGSVPEMCGNGLRCVALYLRHAGLVTEEAFEVETDAGPHGCAVAQQAERAEVTVDMRPASLFAGDVLRGGRGECLDAPFEVDERLLYLTAVSMGNPHAVFFDDVGDELEQLGPRIGRDPRFPAGANVGFARVEGEDLLSLRVWERGAGWTLACGTGACAAAVAAVVTGRVRGDAPVTVRLPGGELRIHVEARGERLRMTGPARRVFQGVMEVDR